MDGVPRIVQLKETGSTNQDALRLALSGEPLPLWVVAERQTAGRGRAGREWVSTEGNLFTSGAYPLGSSLTYAGQLSLVAGVALHDAVCAVGSEDLVSKLRLKWPNDLLAGRHKVGGILLESSGTKDGQGFVAVIGFGLNIVSYPAALDRPVTSLKRHGCDASAGDILAILTKKCDTWIRTWDEGRGFGRIRTEWLERAGPIGEQVTVHTGATRFRGTFQGLSDTGAMLADAEGRRETINFGDVLLDEDEAPSDGG